MGKVGLLLKWLDEPIAFVPYDGSFTDKSEADWMSDAGFEAEIEDGGV